MRTVCETGVHIGIVAELQLDALVWSEMKLSLGAIWLKGDAAVSQRAIAGVLPDQRIGLKSTRVGDDGPLPTTHLVQAAQRGYGGRTWTLHEVKCIHDDSLDAALLQVSAVDRAHNAQRGIGQKGR